MDEAATAAGLSHEITDLERQTMSRVARRLLPLLMVCYFAAYLDRVNVSFAKLTMKGVGLHDSASTVSAQASSSSAISSSKCPATSCSARWARGVDRAHNDLVGHPLGLHSLHSRTGHILLVRFLLGVAEAGFFPASSCISPGGSHPITVPASSACSWQRSQSPTSLAHLSPAFCSISTVGSASPVGNGCSSWRRRRQSYWAVVFWLSITHWPSQAGWLMPAQRDWLIARLNAERSQREAILGITALKNALLENAVPRRASAWSTSAVRSPAMGSYCSNCKDRA